MAEMQPCYAATHKNAENPDLWDIALVGQRAFDLAPRWMIKTPKRRFGLDGQMAASFRDDINKKLKNEGVYYDPSKPERFQT